MSYQHRLTTGNSAWADLGCNGSLYLWNQNDLSTLKKPYRILFSSHNRAEMIHIHVHTFPSTSRTHISSREWCLGLQRRQCSRQICSDQWTCGAIASQLYHRNFSGQEDNKLSVDSALLQPSEAVLSRLHLQSAQRDKLLQGMMNSSWIWSLFSTILYVNPGLVDDCRESLLMNPEQPIVGVFCY